MAHLSFWGQVVLGFGGAACLLYIAFNPKLDDDDSVNSDGDDTEEHF